MVACGFLCGVSSTVLFPLLLRSTLPFLRTFSFAFAHSTHRLASAPWLSIHVRLDSQVTIRSRTYALCAVQRCPSAPHVRAIPGIRSLSPPIPWSQAVQSTGGEATIHTGNQVKRSPGEKKLT